MSGAYVEQFHEEEQRINCRTSYDEAFSAAVSARSTAVDDVIVGFARQTRADPAAARRLFTRYLTTREVSAREHPLPAPPRC